MMRESVFLKDAKEMGLESLSKIIPRELAQVAMLRADGKTYEEVSAITGFSVEMSKNQLATGLSMYAKEKTAPSLKQFSARTANALSGAGFESAWQVKVALKGGYDFLKIKNLGKKSYFEICYKLGVDPPNIRKKRIILQGSSANFSGIEFFINNFECGSIIIEGDHCPKCGSKYIVYGVFSRIEYSAADKKWYANVFAKTNFDIDGHCQECRHEWPARSTPSGLRAQGCFMGTEEQP
jgi:hypothetical protein